MQLIKHQSDSKDSVTEHSNSDNNKDVAQIVKVSDEKALNRNSLLSTFSRDLKERCETTLTVEILSSRNRRKDRIGESQPF
jgi:hypothetical protein